MSLLSHACAVAVRLNRRRRDLFSARRLRGKRRERHMHTLRALCDELPHLKTDPVVVKVGAHDGVSGDPCAAIAEQPDKWRGLLIEPVPQLAEQLRANFPDSERFAIESVGVSDANGEMTFYHVDPVAKAKLPDLPETYDQIGSFDRAHLLEACDGTLGPYIRETAVPVFTLNTLLDKHGIGAIDLLQIDVEGHDYHVLKGIDLKAHHPLVTLIEHRHLDPGDKRSVRRLLASHRLRVYDCGKDYLALDRKPLKALQRRAG